MEKCQKENETFLCIFTLMC